MRAKSTKRFLHSSNYQQLTCILFEHSCFTLNKQTNLHSQIVPMLQNMGLKKSQLFKQLYQLRYNNQITDKHNIVTLLLPNIQVFKSIQQSQRGSTQILIVKLGIYSLLQVLRNSCSSQHLLPKQEILMMLESFFQRTSYFFQ